MRRLLLAITVVASHACAEDRAVAPLLPDPPAVKHRGRRFQFAIDLVDESTGRYVSLPRRGVRKDFLMYELEVELPREYPADSYTFRVRTPDYEGTRHMWLYPVYNSERVSATGAGCDFLHLLADEGRTVRRYLRHDGSLELCRTPDAWFMVRTLLHDGREFVCRLTLRDHELPFFRAFAEPCDLMRVRKCLPSLGRKLSSEEQIRRENYATCGAWSR
jgi:hypothetical protein